MSLLHHFRICIWLLILGHLNPVNGEGFQKSTYHCFSVMKVTTAASRLSCMVLCSRDHRCAAFMWKDRKPSCVLAAEQGNQPLATIDVSAPIYSRVSSKPKFRITDLAITTGNLGVFNGSKPEYAFCNNTNYYYKSSYRLTMFTSSDFKVVFPQPVNISYVQFLHTNTALHPAPTLLHWHSSSASYYCEISQRTAQLGGILYFFKCPPLLTTKSAYLHITFKGYAVLNSLRFFGPGNKTLFPSL